MDHYGKLARHFTPSGKGKKRVWRRRTGEAKRWADATARSLEGLSNMERPPPDFYVLVTPLTSRGGFHLVDIVTTPTCGDDE
jgi:hypothetical protein